MLPLKNIRPCSKPIVQCFRTIAIQHARVVPLPLPVTRPAANSLGTAASPLAVALAVGGWLGVGISFRLKNESGHLNGFR